MYNERFNSIRNAYGNIRNAFAGATVSADPKQTKNFFNFLNSFYLQANRYELPVSRGRLMLTKRKGL